MAAPGNIHEEPSSDYPRLEQQISWYDSKSRSASRFYKWVKFIELVCAALIPFTARAQPNATAALGTLVIVFEGLQHLNQWSQNWITYRSTCEALRHEKHSYLGRAGVYEGKDGDEAKRILVERVESLISTEHAKWISRQEYETKKMQTDDEV